MTTLDAEGGPVDPEGRWAIGAMEVINDVAVVIDTAWTIVYVNPYAVKLLGYPAEALIGRPVSDFVHPEDLIRAIEVMGRISEDDLGEDATPAFYRLLASDGSWKRIELNAGLTTTSRGDLLVALGRYSGDHDLQDRLMEMFSEGASTRELMDLVPEFGRWRQPRAHFAVFYIDDDGVSAAAGSKELIELGGVDDPTTPWAEAAATGQERLAPVAELHPTYRKRAEHDGFTHTWAIPVLDPAERRFAVVAHARASGPDPEVQRYGLENMARAVRVVLRSRHQVAALRRAARIDPLTGLANRTEFWNVLDAAGEADDPGRVGVLYVDLDGFKAVNDTHGHAIGDLVLAETARRVAEVLRPGDTVARIGGDEFAVVCPELGSDQDAMAIADRVVAALELPFPVGDQHVSIGCSVGIATVSPDALDPDALLESADRALYRAKRNGRGQWHLAGSA